MFASLKAQAEKAAKQAQAGAKAAYEQGKERLETGLAGKKMLDEGGEKMADKLLAKKASQDATALDLKFIGQLALLVEAYGDTVTKVEGAAPIAAEAGESPDFGKLKTDYEARTASLRAGLEKVNTIPAGKDSCIPVAAVTSPPEKDALAILSTKQSAAMMKQSVVDVGKEVSAAAKGGGSSSAASAPLVDASSNEAAQRDATDEVVAAGEAGKSSTGTISDKAHAVVDAGKQRMSVLQAGKKLHDEASQEEQKQVLLLAKKVATEAVSLDQKTVALLKQTIEAYDDTAEKMKASADYAKSQPPPEDPPFEVLATGYARRAAELQAILDGFNAVPEPPTVSPQETDAIRMLVAKMAAMDVKNAAMGAASSVRGGYCAKDPCTKDPCA